MYWEYFNFDSNQQEWFSSFLCCYCWLALLASCSFQRILFQCSFFFFSDCLFLLRRIVFLRRFVAFFTSFLQKEAIFNGNIRLSWKILICQFWSFFIDFNFHFKAISSSPSFLAPLLHAISCPFLLQWNF